MNPTTTAGEKLVLIDGHSLAYRAFHALPTTLTTRRGEIVNAAYGFTTMLLNILKDEQPAYIGVAFDVGRTFRHEQYPNYKGHRARMPEELRDQIERIKEILDALRIPIFTLEGYEADDVLGTLSRQASEHDLQTVIVTGDTDAFQLVDDHVRVLTSGRKFSDTRVYDEAAIQERYGLSPQQLIDLKGLMGDKSDNIPGVAGVGEKTATTLLKEYHSIDNIYEHLDEISSTRARNALTEQRDEAYMSRGLVTIVRDAPIQLDLEGCKLGDYDQPRVLALFRDLEFRTLVDRLPATAGASAAPGQGQQLSMFGDERTASGATSEPAGDYEVIADEKALNRLAKQLSGASALAFDTETTSTRAMQADLVGISLSIEAGKAVYIPVGHSQGSQLPLELVREKLSPVLANAGIIKVAHNAIYDLIILRRHGFVVAGDLFDTMIAAWLIDPSSRNLGLKGMAWGRLGVEMTPISDLIGTGKKQRSMADVAIEQAAPYAAADADMTLRLYELLAGELKEKKLWSLFADIEMPLVPVLVDMEMAGIRLDAGVLREMGKEIHARMMELDRGIQDTVGYALNIRSTQQLSDALFVHLGLPTRGLRKTASGHYSTAAEVLEGLQDAHPIVNDILEHRQISKLQSTYIETLPELVNPETGRIHTSFNQTGTVTGRLSSSDPNLQNIPARTPLGRRVREAFVAEEGWTLFAADYSQVELRILAHVSEDPALLDAFAHDEDIHAFTAARVFDVSLDDVTPDMRRIAKTTNFAIIYGVTGYGLAQQTSLSPEEATEFIRTYFERYPQVKAYLDRCKIQAAELGYVETLLGRRRYFPELQSDRKAHAGLRAAAERMAINMPIQGTAADIIKIAMIRLHDELQKRQLRSRQLLQVHDELLLETPDSELDQVSALVIEIMEQAYRLKVPLKVDCKAGHNWGQMTPR